MNHIIKCISLIVLLFSPIAIHASKKSKASWDWRAVNSLNAKNPWFPGTYPLNERKKVDEIGTVVTNFLKRWVDLPSFKVPDFFLDRDTSMEDKPVPLYLRPIHPRAQLAFAVVCKWIPAFLIVKSLLKSTMRSGSKERSERS